MLGDAWCHLSVMDIMTKNNLLGADDRLGSDGRGRQDVSFERQTPWKIAADDGCGVDTKDSEIADRREKRKSESKKGTNGNKERPFCSL